MSKVSFTSITAWQLLTVLIACLFVAEVAQTQEVSQLLPFEQEVLQRCKREEITPFLPSVCLGKDAPLRDDIPLCKHAPDLLSCYRTVATEQEHPKACDALPDARDRITCGTARFLWQKMEPYQRQAVWACRDTFSCFVQLATQSNASDMCVFSP